ncbi:hypothetical protein HanIR_Chr14g0708551 [Helianthus annuus]|nr:hypothetical protein HanIR_Chr14g0708551 [Helianthus annuus]
MLSESISGTLMMTSLIRSLAAIASEKYFKLDKPEPNDLSSLDLSRFFKQITKIIKTRYIHKCNVNNQ